jgi:hypothetical protein
MEWIGGPSETSKVVVCLCRTYQQKRYFRHQLSRTNGKVKATRPVKVMETLIEGIWFEFKDGKVS